MQLTQDVRIRSTKTCITFCFQVQLSHLSLEAKRTVRLLDLHKKSFVQRQAIKQRQLRSMGITSLSIIPDDIAEAHAKVNEQRHTKNGLKIIVISSQKKISMGLLRTVLLSSKIIFYAYYLSIAIFTCPAQADSIISTPIIVSVINQRKVDFLYIVQMPNKQRCLRTILNNHSKIHCINRILLKKRMSVDAPPAFHDP